MTRTKATVRRIRQPTFVLAPGQRIRNKNIMNRRNSMLTIKILLPRTRQVEVKKNNQVVRRINIRQKSHYFFGNRSLQF